MLSKLITLSIYTLGSFSSSSSSSTLLDVSGTPRFGVGGGVAVGYVAAEKLAIELGAAYVTRAQTLAGIDLTYQYLMFPLQLRVRPLPYLELGAGPYFASGVGGIRHGLAGDTVTYESSSNNRFDFGAVASLGGYFEIKPGAKLFVEGRAQQGLANIDQTPNVSETWRDFQILAGFRIGG